MAQQFVINLSDRDLAILRHDLLDPEAWIMGAVVGKLASCTDRLIRDGSALLVADENVTSMPADRLALAATILEHPNYLDRRARDIARVVADHGYGILATDASVSALMALGLDETDARRRLALPEA